MVVTVVGGGSSAHVLIPLATAAGHEVQLLTRRPADWSRRVAVERQDFEGAVQETLRGTLTRVSDDPAELIPRSDLVVLCMPVCKYRVALHGIAPHLRRDREVFVGTIYGQAGFNWMVEEVAGKHELANVVTFAVGLIPWICRVLDYGSRGVTWGGKQVNLAAVSPRDRFAELNERFLRWLSETWLGTGAFRQADSFLSLTLSVDNQIVHPSRCYGLFRRYGGRWERQEDIPYFYRDFDELSADVLRELDADYSKVRDAIRDRFPERDFPHMLDYLALERFSHRSGHTDVRESFTASPMLGAIKPPTRRSADGAWVIDTDHRFFTDDIGYGICIPKWMAERLGVEVPTIDRLLEWVQELRGETFIAGGRLQVDSESLAGPFRSGIPPVYGIRTIDQAVD